MTSPTDRITDVLLDELEQHGLDDMGFDATHVAERIAAELQSNVDEVAQAICEAHQPYLGSSPNPSLYRFLARAALSAWSAVEEKP